MRVRFALACLLVAAGAVGAVGAADPPGGEERTPAHDLANANPVDRFRDRVDRLGPTLVASPDDAADRLRVEVDDFLTSEFGKDFVAGVNIEVVWTDAVAAKVEPGAERTRIFLPAKWAADPKRNETLCLELYLGVHAAKAAAGRARPPGEAQVKAAERERERIRKAFAAYVPPAGEVLTMTRGGAGIDVVRMPERSVPVSDLVITDRGVEVRPPGAAPQVTAPESTPEPWRSPVTDPWPKKVRAGILLAAAIVVLIAANRIGVWLGRARSGRTGAVAVVVLSAAVGAGVAAALIALAKKFPDLELAEHPTALVAYGVLLGLVAGCLASRNSRPANPEPSSPAGEPTPGGR